MNHHPGRGPWLTSQGPNPTLTTLMHNSDTSEPTWDTVYTYTRAQAVADGIQVEVTKTAAEAGISIPVFLTRTVYESYVTVPPGVSCQDEAGRLWDILWMLRHAIRGTHGGQAYLAFALYVRNDDRAARLVKLVATCGPVDIDDPAPCITVLMPDED